MAKDFTVLLDDSGAKKIMAVIKDVRFVGGCVRDVLMDRPVGDMDMATALTPDQTMKALQDNDIKVIPTGIDHGTVTAVIDKKHYEITTLRKDISTDGRHAVVEHTDSWEEDAKRRDFTINSLSVDADGKLYDYCNGERDIENQILRFIGDASSRIKEDYLRILRFFRFASVLDWEFNNPADLQACIELSPHLKNLSRERIQTELYKLLIGKGCVRVVTIMAEHKILLPYHLENFIEMVALDQDKDPLRRLIALSGVRLDEFIVLSRDDKKRIESLQNAFRNPDWGLDKMLYYFGLQTTRDYYYLTGTDPRVVSWNSPVFPLKAEDVMPLTDGPGPKVGELLKRAEEYWVDHDFRPSKEDLLALVK